MQLVPESNVVELQCITTLSIPCDRVLEAAKGKLQTVLVIGYDKEGHLYFAASEGDGPSNLWLLKTAELDLFKTGGLLPGVPLSTD